MELNVKQKLISLIISETGERYKEETGYTLGELVKRGPAVLTDREDRNAARRRFTEIDEQVTKELITFLQDSLIPDPYFDQPRYSEK